MIFEFLPKIDLLKCVGCQLCVKICPNNVLAVIEKAPVLARPDACEYSGICEEVCPAGAIRLSYEIVFSGE